MTSVRNRIGVANLLRATRGRFVTECPAEIRTQPISKTNNVWYSIATIENCMAKSFVLFIANGRLNILVTKCFKEEWQSGRLHLS